MSSAGLNPRLRDWHGQGVWIVGASSGIGLATAEASAEKCSAMPRLSASSTAGGRSKRVSKFSSTP